MQKLDFKQNLKKLIFSFFFLIFLRKIRELPLQKVLSQTWNKESLKKRLNSLKNLHFVEDFLKIKK